jgi:solute carrier family 45 protein 1/2/4
VLVQPFFGIWSDNSRLRWGRRRPFIASGAFATIFFLLGFAWVKTVVDTGVWLTFGNEDVQQDTYQRLLIAWASLFICFLNIAIQAVQCGARALIVDKCPPHQQDRANACASCMIGIGNIISYSIGSSDLSSIVLSPDESQVKGMSLLASSILGLTVWLTCVSITEDNLPLLQSRTDFKSPYALETLKQIFTAAKNLSALSKRVYIVQFFSWMGWFAFLTYNTM